MIGQVKITKKNQVIWIDKRNINKYIDNTNNNLNRNQTSNTNLTVRACVLETGMILVRKYNNRKSMRSS